MFIIFVISNSPYNPQILELIKNQKKINQNNQKKTTQKPDSEKNQKKNQKKSKKNTQKPDSEKHQKKHQKIKQK